MTVSTWRVETVCVVIDRECPRGACRHWQCRPVGHMAGTTCRSGGLRRGSGGCWTRQAPGRTVFDLGLRRVGRGRGRTADLPLFRRWRGPERRIEGPSPGRRATGCCLAASRDPSTLRSALRSSASMFSDELTLTGCVHHANGVENGPFRASCVAPLSPLGHSPETALLTDGCPRSRRCQALGCAPVCRL